MPDQFLATQLKRVREQRGFTQEGVAHDAGITVSALSRIERGLNSPGWTTVRDIAEALEISISDLVAGVEDLEGAEEDGR